MHDPETRFLLVKTISIMHVFDKRKWRRTKSLVEVWYVDPTGRDADHELWFKMGKTKFLLKNFRDMQLHFLPYINIKRKFRRCEECGGFGGKRNPVNFGYMSSDKHWHEACMALRGYRGASKEYLEALVILNVTKEELLEAGMDDWNKAWRCGYAVEKQKEKLTACLESEK